MIGLLSNAVKRLLHGRQNNCENDEAATSAAEAVVEEHADNPMPLSSAVKANEPPKKLPVVTRKCIDAVNKIKQLFMILEKERDPFSKTYIDIKLAAYQLKDLAKRGGFPMGVDLAAELHDHMANLKVLDDKTILILKFHIDALAAVFVENRKSNKDETAQEVINDLRKISGCKRK